MSAGRACSPWRSARMVIPASLFAGSGCRHACRLRQAAPEVRCDDVWLLTAGVRRVGKACPTRAPRAHDRSCPVRRRVSVERAVAPAVRGARQSTRASPTDDAPMAKAGLGVMASMPASLPRSRCSYRAGCGAAMKAYGHLLDRKRPRSSAHASRRHEWAGAADRAVQKGKTLGDEQVAHPRRCHLGNVQSTHEHVRTCCDRRR